MQKTDNRHSNNTRANKNLHLEMDLWIAFKNNNEQPVLISTHVDKGRFEDGKFCIYYAPIERIKNLPFLLTYECGKEFDSTRHETLQSAKYYLKKTAPNAKWQRKN